MPSHDDQAARPNGAINSAQDDQRGEGSIQTVEVNSALAEGVLDDAIHLPSKDKAVTTSVEEIKQANYDAAVLTDRRDTKHSALLQIEVKDGSGGQLTGSKLAKHVTVSEEVKEGEGTQLSGAEAHELRAEDSGKNWPEPEKKKKKKKSSGKHKKPNPTGFEEFYADPPITPSEYNDEYFDVYSNSRSFIERIEQCIQRYRAIRKLDEVRANVFNKYMTLGGIDTSIRAFTGGLDQDTIENSTAAEIAGIQAQDYIRGSTNPKFYNPDNAKNWIIDFEGVAKGFLSHRAPEAFGRDPPVIKQYCAVVRNFLNYVTHHGVCPEYTHDIIAAKMICDRAERELPAINEVGKAMPGDFNMAASTLYGGYYHNLYAGTCTWSPEFCEEDTVGRFPSPNKRRVTGMTVPEADRIFKTAIAFAGTYEMFEGMKKSPKVIKKEVRSMEVISVTLPNPEKKKLYAGTKDVDGLAGNIKPLGLLTVKHWDNAQAEDEDLTEEEEAAEVALRKSRAKDGGSVEKFWLEEELLEKCFAGMKFEATVHELNIGVKYFDSIIGIYPSFFTYLPSDRLYGWREPVLSTRPPPSVNNPVGFEDDVAEFD